MAERQGDPCPYVWAETTRDWLQGGPGSRRCTRTDGPHEWHDATPKPPPHVPKPVPPLVWVVGMPYTVRQHGGKPGPLKDEAQLSGATDGHNLVITIDASMHPAQQRVTLVHELLHAACQVLDYSLKDKAEERLVRALAPVLLQALRTNPDLSAYLLDGEP